MRSFLLYFIEGSSYIEEDDYKWEFLVVYKNNNNSFEFVGFVSFYLFYYYHQIDVLKRLRIR